jgi:hypothetical protein
MKITVSIFLLCLFTIPITGQTAVRARVLNDSFDAVSEQRLNNSMQSLQEIFNSDEFKVLVRAADLSVGNRNLTNVQILQLILSGANNYKNAAPDGVIEFPVRVFDKYKGWGNFGTTFMKPSNARITETHRCYILNNSPECYTAHLAHEYMHLIGFTDKRDGWFGPKTNAVPYRIGNIVEELLGGNLGCSAQKTTCSKG